MDGFGIKKQEGWYEFKTKKQNLWLYTQDFIAP